VSNPFDELQAEAEAEPKPKPTLDAIRAMAQRGAKIESEIASIESRLSVLKTERYNLLNKELPAVMDDARVSNITVDGYKFECDSYYKANIAADDPEAKREAAFAWVEEAGGGDIIANTVTVAFPKELAKDAAEFARETRARFDNRREVEVRQEKKVPWNRLTSWLREYVESPPKPDKPKLPIPLDNLNATIGRVVKIKPVSD
jgi:hypothetical protein